MDYFIINGEEIFQVLEEKQISGKFLTKRSNHILYETENSIIKKSFTKYEPSINEYGDYAFKSSILLEAFCMNILSKNNKMNFPNLIDVFTNEGYLCLEMEKINGFTLTEISKELSDDQKNIILFQVLYALYLADVYDFSHGDLIGSNIMIEFSEPKDIIYNIEGKEFKFSNEGITIKLIDFEFSRITVYKTYIFNENVRSKYYKNEYDVIFEPAIDIGKLFGNPNLITEEIKSLFNDIKFNYNSRYQVIPPFPEIKSIDVLLKMLNLPSINKYKENKTINEVKSLQSDKELILLLENPNIVSDKTELLNNLSNHKYNRLIYKFLNVFPEINLEYDKIYPSFFSYTNNRKVINKMLSLIKNLEYIKPIKNFLSYKIDKCSIETIESEKTNDLDIIDPIMLELVNSKEWLKEEDNIIIEVDDFKYATKSIYFKDIPLNNILLNVVLNKNNEISFKQTLNSDKYLNLNKYGIPSIVKLDIFLISMNKKILKLSKNTELPLINYNYIIHNPNSYYLFESDFYGYEQKEFQSLKNYTYKWDRAVNTYLRKNISDEEYLKDKEFLKYYSDFGDFPEESLQNIKDTIKNIDEVFFKTVKTQFPMIVYRGINNKNIYEGLSLGYTSTTTSYNSALNFSKDGVVYKINIPEGIPYISLENVTIVKEEKEYLFPRNIILKHIGNYNFNMELQDENQFNTIKDYSYYNIHSIEDIEDYQENKEKIENRCFKNNIEDGNVIDEITGDIIDPENSFNEDGMCFNKSTLIKLFDECLLDYSEFINPFTRINFSEECILSIIDLIDNDIIFQYFCFYGKLNVVKYLIQNKNINEDQINQGLFCVSSNGNLELVKFLVENGADIYTTLF